MDRSPPRRGSLNATRACALAEVSLAGAGAATAFNSVGGGMKARKIAEGEERMKYELRRMKRAEERMKEEMGEKG